tara:strand:+ start:651 stop:812 length:162 start_codon:yes stop_codon:yes gene_type:complete
MLPDTAIYGTPTVLLVQNPAFFAFELNFSHHAISKYLQEKFISKARSIKIDLA